MKYKILIDATTVTSVVDGLSNYIIGLIKHLPSDSLQFFDYSILVNPNLQRPEFWDAIDGKDFKVVERKIRPIGPKRDWDMYWFLRKYEASFDLIHITSNNYPFSLKKGICTIHDITFKRFFDHPKFSFNLATFYMDKVIANCLKRSSAVIAVSESTKKELVKWYELSPRASEKIVVIYQGYEHINSDISPTELCLNRPDGRYLFYLGTFRIHKNISNLLKGFKSAMSRLPEDIKLVVSGSERFLKPADREIIGQINENGLRVIFSGYLSNACVKEFFSASDAYIFPSISEGFGIPVLEAFYYNKPLLCSNTTSLPEVAGDAAIYFDPYDVESIANAIVEFYANPSHAADLVKKGAIQLRKFSWNKTAIETVQLYKKHFEIN